MNNNEALEGHRKHIKNHSGEKIPPNFTRAEALIARHLCSVLLPLELVSRELHEATAKPRASSVLPTVLAVLHALQPETPTPLCDVHGTFGSESSGQESIKTADLIPLARKLKAFLSKSLEHTLEKFLERAAGGNPSFKMLCVCSYLGPRYKTLYFLTEKEKDTTYESTRDALVAIVTRSRESATHLTQKKEEVRQEFQLDQRGAAATRVKHRRRKASRCRPFAKEESSAYGADDLLQEQAAPGTAEKNLHIAVRRALQDVPSFSRHHYLRASGGLLFSGIRVSGIFLTDGLLPGPCTSY